MRKITEDQSGWDGSFVKQLDSKGNPIGAVIDGASNLVKDFHKYKTQNDLRIQRELEAKQKKEQAEAERLKKKQDEAAKKDADDAEKLQKRIQKRIHNERATAEALRKSRKEDRDNQIQRQKDEQEAAAKDRAKKEQEGHIMMSNFKFKYREFLLTFAASDLHDLFYDGKIEHSVLPKMYKYGKAIDVLFQKYPGSLVSSIRQGRFHQHDSMIKMVGNKNTDSKSDGPYRLIHKLFVPKHLDHNAMVQRGLIIDAAKKLFSTSSMPSGVASPNYYGFTGETCVVFFNHILQATGVESADYIVIGWYNNTYEHVVNLGMNFDGVPDEDRKPSFDIEDVDEFETQYREKIEAHFPILFFQKFSDVFELIRVENMKMLTSIESLIRRSGTTFPSEEELSTNDSQEDNFEDHLETEPKK